MEVKLKFFHHAKAYLLCLLVLSFAISSHAAWPDRDVTFIVPFPPAGNTDTVARLIATNVSSSIGKQIIVENRPGAGSMIGSQLVARAKPDGYTFLVGSISNVLNHFFYKKPLYDITNDLIPVSQIINVPNYIVVGDKSEIKTFRDLLIYAKSNPEKVTCATTGVGTSTYLTCEMIKAMAGVSITNVPYKGGSAALQSAMAGEVTFAVANEALPFIKDGRVMGLAVTTPTRSIFVPNIPAVSEYIPNFDVTSWYGVFAPAGTSKEIVNDLASKIQATLKQPEVIKKLESLGAVPVGTSPKEFARYINLELKKWEIVIKPLNVSVD
jgi:tripartite-type tricarboxylate transporter receptor subunit TctC